MKACETAAAKEATPDLAVSGNSFASNLLDWGGRHNDSCPPQTARGCFSSRQEAFSTGRALTEPMKPEADPTNRCEEGLGMTRINA